MNLFFLLNIVRVLITKLKVTHQAESSLYMKAVRATLILVPLLGIQFLLLPYKPAGRVASEIYDYVTQILIHSQVQLWYRVGDLDTKIWGFLVLIHTEWKTLKHSQQDPDKYQLRDLSKHWWIKQHFLSNKLNQPRKSDSYHRSDSLLFTSYLYLVSL